MARTYIAKCQTCKKQFGAVENKNRSWPYTEICPGCFLEDHESRLVEINTTVDALIPSVWDQLEARITAMEKCIISLMAKNNTKGSRLQAELYFAKQVLEAAKDIVGSDSSGAIK